MQRIQTRNLKSEQLLISWLKIDSESEHFLLAVSALHRVEGACHLPALKHHLSMKSDRHICAATLSFPRHLLTEILKHECPMESTLRLTGLQIVPVCLAYDSLMLSWRVSGHLSSQPLFLIVCCHIELGHDVLLRWKWRRGQTDRCTDSLSAAL